MKLSTLIVVALGLWFAAASAAHSSKKVYGQLDITQVAQVPVNTWTGDICATSPKLFINVNHLHWALRRHDSKLRLLPGSPANCRRYYAPASTYGWDRITVSYRYRGATYVAQTQFYVTHPQRP